MISLDRIYCAGGPSDGVTKDVNRMLHERGKTWNHDGCYHPAIPYRHTRDGAMVWVWIHCPFGSPHDEFGLPVSSGPLCLPSWEVLQAMPETTP